MIKELTEDEKDAMIDFVFYKVDQLGTLSWQIQDRHLRTIFQDTIEEIMAKWRLL